MHINLLACCAFVAYSKAVGGKTFDGRDIPSWEELTPEVQNGWKESVKEVVHQLTPDLKTDREQKTVDAAIAYDKDPYGDVAHNLKILLAKYANSLKVEDI